MDQIADDVQVLFRQIVGYPAKAHVVAHHARARDHLEEVQDQLPLLDGVQSWREESPQIVEQKADGPEVVDDARQLNHEDSDVLCALRDLDPYQFFYSQGIAQVVGHGADIVQPVGVGHVGQPQIALADLLMVAVEIAHHRLEVYHGLTVEKHLHLEDTMGAGVLGA